MKIELGTAAKRNMHSISQLKLSPYTLNLETARIRIWKTFLYISEAGVEWREDAHNTPGAAYASASSRATNRSVDQTSQFPDAALVSADFYKHI